MLYRHCDASITQSSSTCTFLKSHLDVIAQTPSGISWRRLASYPLMASPTSLHLCHAFQRAATTTYPDARLEARVLRSAAAEVSSIMYAVSSTDMEHTITQLLDCDDEDIAPAFNPRVSRLRRASDYKPICIKCQCSGCDCNSGYACLYSPHLKSNGLSRRCDSSCDDFWGNNDCDNSCDSSCDCDTTPCFCPKGTGGNPSDNGLAFRFCLDCKAGKAQGMDAKRECAECAVGKFAAEKAASECVSCPAGMFKDSATWLQVSQSLALISRELSKYDWTTELYDSQVE